MLLEIYKSFLFLFVLEISAVHYDIEPEEIDSGMRANDAPQNLHPSAANLWVSQGQPQAAAHSVDAAWEQTHWGNVLPPSPSTHFQSNTHQQQGQPWQVMQAHQASQPPNFVAVAPPQQQYEPRRVAQGPKAAPHLDNAQKKAPPETVKKGNKRMASSLEAQAAKKIATRNERNLIQRQIYEAEYVKARWELAQLMARYNYISPDVQLGIGQVRRNLKAVMKEKITKYMDLIEPPPPLNSINYEALQKQRSINMQKYLKNSNAFVFKLSYILKAEGSNFLADLTNLPKIQIIVNRLSREYHKENPNPVIIDKLKGELRSAVSANFPLPVALPDYRTNDPEFAAKVDAILDPYEKQIENKIDIIIEYCRVQRALEKAEYAKSLFSSLL